MTILPDESPWGKTLEQYGGMAAVIATIQQEGLHYFVVDYLGADAFVGGPLERPAKMMEEATAEFERALGI
jgi:hypothetical protein